MFHWTIFPLWSKAAFVDFFYYTYKYVVTKIILFILAALEKKIFPPLWYHT